jgi:hypothetical protein
MKKIIFLVAFLFVGAASAQQASYMAYGGNGFAGYGLTTSGTGSHVGFVFNNGADTWGLGYGSSIQGAGTSVLTWAATGAVSIPGAVSISTTTLSGGLILQSWTLAQLALITPASKGEIGFCSDCIGACKIVFSTSTALHGWATAVSSTTYPN